MYAVSRKIKSDGDIHRVTPNDGREYFFGYYDKSPWDSTERYMLCLRVKETYKSVAPNEEAEIILIDTSDNNSFRIIGKSKAWNVQQGCMLQWLGPDFSESIIFNDFREEKYCSVILNIRTGKEKIVGMPVYSVSNNGTFALTLDFSRLHRLRKGYGYSNIPETTRNEKVPDKPCIWCINLETGVINKILNYTDFLRFESTEQMEDAEHKVNHIMLNPSGDRFMVLHRWFVGSQKYTRLVTVNIDGTDMYNLNNNMTSHCFWKNDAEILAFANKKEIGNGYFLMKDKTQEFQKLWPELLSDGHPSYSPDRSMVVTDTYPDRSRVARIYLIKDEKIHIIAKIFAPFRYDNEVRCDLHPRWNHAGDKICVDSVHEGKRGLYTISVPAVDGNVQLKEPHHELGSILVSCVVPTYKRSDMLLRAVKSALAQTHEKVEVLVVDDNDPNDEYSVEVQNKLKSIEDSRLFYIQQEKHINGAVARNVGIKSAKGKYVAFLDDDDEWLPEKIDSQLAYMKENHDCKGCSCLYSFYKGGIPIMKCPPYTNDNLLFKILSRSVQMYTSTIMLEREYLFKSGLFDEELIRHQDLQMLADFAAIAKIAVLAEYLVKINMDSDINRPNTAKTIEVKKIYLSKMKKHILTFSKREQKRIYGAHDFEVLVQGVKEKKTIIVAKYMMKIGFNVEAYKDVYARYRNKKDNRF